LIERVAPDRAAPVIDIGAGASTLVDGLLASGYDNLTVLDLSASALALTQQRLGNASTTVHWQAADVLSAVFAEGAYSVWHDRAVFHFLTDPVDRARYVAQVRRAVRPSGHVLVATFAEDGPSRCSGLEVARYSPKSLHAEFGSPFELVESHRELHATPAGVQQAFTYCVCRVVPESRWHDAA
jgi:2-polyprenyl-3-methyl-5-hydroxy-6-metoxy-1,4-benzoquinol methylase